MSLLFFNHADIEIVRLVKGLVQSFITQFQPLLDNVSNGKGELERRARVANDEST